MTWPRTNCPRELWLQPVKSRPVNASWVSSVHVLWTSVESQLQDHSNRPSSTWCRRVRRPHAASSGRGSTRCRGSPRCAAAGTWCSWGRCGSASCRRGTGRTWGRARPSARRTCGRRAAARTALCCATLSGARSDGPTPRRPETGRRCTRPPAHTSTIQLLNYQSQATATYTGAAHRDLIIARYTSTLTYLPAVIDCLHIVRGAGSA